MIGPGSRGALGCARASATFRDPDEYLKVPAKSVRAKNGLLSFRFMEPMEETVYLDQVRLLAIDHPANVRSQSERALRQRAAIPGIPRDCDAGFATAGWARGMTTATMCCRCWPSATAST